MSNNAHNVLCNTCDELFNKVRNIGWHQDLLHHASLEALESSAGDYCGICTILFNGVEQANAKNAPGVQKRLFPIRCEVDTSSAVWQESFEATFSFADFHPDTGNGLSIVITFVATASKEEAPTPPVYVPPAWTNSPDCRAQIDRWLTQCTLRHSRCNAVVGGSWAPTRLVDLGSLESPGVKLVLAEEASAAGEGKVGSSPYATLSHCWGRNPPLLTTESNFHAHRHEIPECDLPKTFRDAIDFARSLSLRYLWVDTLCIIQGSHEDWSREAGLMSKVYRNAFINIAATGASHGAEGLFWERKPEAVRPTLFSMTWDTTVALRGHTRTYQVVPDHATWADKLLNQPLNRRGWVFQERILSPRIIHFGNEQVFWECRESIACETYPDGLPPSLRQNTAVDIKTLDLGDVPRDDKWTSKYISGARKKSDSILQWFWNSLRPTIVQEISLTATINPPSVYKDWDAVVELYSRGKLSFPGDRLIALSGIVSTVQERGRHVRDDGYLAGLWHSSLPSHLLWTTERPTSNNGNEYGRFSNQEYIAPSWSWASVDGYISFRWCQRNYDVKDYLVAVESAQITQAGFDRFGGVRMGCLVLCGHLAAVTFDRKYCSILEISPAITCPPYHRPTRVSPEHDTGSEVFLDYLDIDTDNSEPSNSRSMTFMPIIGIAKSAIESECVRGLVLVPSAGTVHSSLQMAKQKEFYERIGVFQTTRPRVCKILSNLPRQTINIL